MSVYYKFNSELNYSYVDFDGLHISVSDLKKSIFHQKRLGKADFDLMISNAQTKEQYVDEQCLIPKNTSLIVARVPISNQHKKAWEQAQSSVERAPQNQSTESINHDITRMNGSEEDKIQAMMMQSTLDYDPTNYQRVRGTTQSGDVPPNYRCHKCHKPGHWIKNCPLNPPGGKEHHHFKTRPESKKMTGIPRSLRDNIGAESQETVQNQFVEEKREIPEDLICAICKGIFKDAVMIPCCGSSFCDECVRTALLESEENECPDCKEKGTSPGSLIPNRFLRNAVTTFHAESSNVLSREKKISEEATVTEAFEEVAADNEELIQESDSRKETDEMPSYEYDRDDLSEKNSIELASGTAVPIEKDTESEDDDDNITVTVPPAHQQSRGAAFRDSRLRRVPSHGMGDFHESYSHSAGAKNQDDGESFEEDNSEAYSQRQYSNSKKPNHSYEHASSSNTPQGISTLVGDDKGSSQSMYHSSSPHLSNPNLSHSDSKNMYLQQQQTYNQNQHQSSMMPHMNSHQMYQQGPYQQQPYFPPNQMRPMRFEHQGNYQVPVRQHHAPMMRAMQDNYGGMRQHRPPINNLANAVTQNIQQRYGTGIIDDPLEAFNRIMREKELRKDRYRRSPMHGNERRSRSFERKRSPMHQYSPDNRRTKNYPKTRKRSRSFKRSKSRSYSPNSMRGRSKSRTYSPLRGRSKSRSYSPRYRRKENVMQHGKDRRDDRHRSPIRNRGSQNNRNSRGTYKGDLVSKQGSRGIQESHHHHDNNIGNQHDKNDQHFEFSKETNAFDPSHSLDEQPPPPGDESETINLQLPKDLSENESHVMNLKSTEDEAPKDPFEVNGSNKLDMDSKKAEHHHHRKKSRGKNYDTSSEDKKSRDKKKRKKSKEHEKKKSKKDRKVRSDRDSDKKTLSKAESVEKTPESVAPLLDVITKEDNVDTIENKMNHPDVCTKEGEEHTLFANRRNKSADSIHDYHKTPKSRNTDLLNRSDSILDINPNIDLEMDDYVAPEVSKWEREEYKSATSLDNSEVDVAGDTKKNSEEKVTSEILKRAEHAIFARAISAIRPVENKKVKSVQDHEVSSARKESSPIACVTKKNDTSIELKAFQVTVPANESGNRSVEIKTPECKRETVKKKSPMRTSIKNRLGIKVVDKKERSTTPPRSPKRRLQPDLSRVPRQSRDEMRGYRSQVERTAPTSRERHPSSENRRNANKQQLSSCIRVSNEAGGSSRSNRSRYNDKKRSPTPEDRKNKRVKLSRSRSSSRHNARRHDRKPSADRNYMKSKESVKSDDKSSKTADALPSDNGKSKERVSRKNTEASNSKKKRDSSSSSSASTSASSAGSQKHSKRHGKHKLKKKSRSLSAESSIKRKKSKKEKKAKKKKKSSRK